MMVQSDVGRSVMYCGKVWLERAERLLESEKRGRGGTVR
jgi:hypothetical protein